MTNPDSPRRSCRFVAVDEIGCRLGTTIMRANTNGPSFLLQWVEQFAGHDAAGVRFAVEDCRHMTRLLEADLFRTGQRVMRVRVRLMACTLYSSR